MKNLTEGKTMSKNENQNPFGVLHSLAVEIKAQGVKVQGVRHSLLTLAYAIRDGAATDQKEIAARLKELAEVLRDVYDA